MGLELLLGCLVVSGMLMTVPRAIADVIATVKAASAGQWDVVNRDRDRRAKRAERWGNAWRKVREARNRQAGGNGVYRPGVSAYMGDVYHGWCEDLIDRRKSKRQQRGPAVYDPTPGRWKRWRAGWSKRLDYAVDDLADWWAHRSGEEPAPRQDDNRDDNWAPPDEPAPSPEPETLPGPEAVPDPDPGPQSGNNSTDAGDGRLRCPSCQMKTLAQINVDGSRSWRCLNCGHIHDPAGVHRDPHGNPRPDHDESRSPEGKRDKPFSLILHEHGTCDPHTCPHGHGGGPTANPEPADTTRDLPFTHTCTGCGGQTRSSVDPAELGDIRCNLCRNGESTPATEGDNMPDTTPNAGNATGDAHDVESALQQCDLLAEDLTRIDTGLDVIDEAMSSASSATELLEAFLRSKNVEDGVAGMSVARDMLSPTHIKALIDAIAAAKQGVAATRAELLRLQDVEQQLNGADGSVLNGR